MDSEDRHYSLYKFKHKKSNTVFFGRGKTPRDCVEELSEIINLDKLLVLQVEEFVNTTKTVKQRKKSSVS